jgi:beta-glucosidase-like glycosyl hydrolase
MRKTFLVVAAAFAGVCGLWADAQQKAVYADPAAPVEARITDLLSKMTLEEKINAFSTDPTIPRLGVVGTGHVEGLHGLALGGPGHWEGREGRGYKTVIPTTTFPQSRGLGQTWDPELLSKAAAQEAFETRYALGKYHRGGLVVRAPNADLSRDPRWGRSEESYGEDAFLVGTLATAFTRGLQGDGKYWMTASLLKHFLANSNENLRTSSSSDFDERLFQEYYSVPFRMAIEEGHANAFMTAYNSWNGTPMIENPVLRDVVMKVWGEDGIICTDGGALAALVKDHHAYNTLPEALAATVHAGINQYLDDYKAPMEDALKQGLLTEADLDRNLRGVFRVMIRLGMLDPNSMVTEGLIGDGGGVVGDPWDGEAAKALARKVTDESIVLLKNEGAETDSRFPAGMEERKARTTAEAKAKTTAEAKAKTTAEAKARTTAEAKAKTTAEAKARTTAEAKAKTTAEAKAKTTAEAKAKTTAEAKARTTAEALLPLDAGKVKSIAVIGPYADKVILDWYSGTPPYAVTPLAGIKARAGAGVSVEYADGKDLVAASALAKRVDVAVVVIGNHPTCDAGWEKCPVASDGKEAVDRKSLVLEQEEIAKAVVAANPRTVVVLQASFPFTTVWTEEHVPAVVEMTHGSEEQGDGLADVLFGDYDPAGRLTQTWVRDEAELPAMMDYDIRHGRTYMYAKAKPLYAFGFGLSYTTFGYSNLKVSKTKLGGGSTAMVSVDVKNTGGRVGDEVVQMYVAHEGSKVPRAAEELKGFVRVSLRPGESKTVTMPLAAGALAYWDEGVKGFVVERDRVEVRVGASSEDVRLKAVVEVGP